METKEFNRCLDRIRNGDRQALEGIYTKFYAKMTFTALAKINNIQAAEDIASDFIKYILENAKSIPYIENPVSWIITCINNRTVSYIRKERMAYNMACDEAVFTQNSPDNDLYFELARSFKDLAAAEQELVLLHYIYGYKYKELSRMLGKPEGTIKRQIFVIKQKLKHLKKY